MHGIDRDLSFFAIGTKHTCLASQMSVCSHLRTNQTSFNIQKGVCVVGIGGSELLVKVFNVQNSDRLLSFGLEKEACSDFSIGVKCGAHACLDLPEACGWTQIEEFAATQMLRLTMELALERSQVPGR